MDRQLDHKAMRIVVGINAILIAPIVYFLADTSEPIASISASYWTNSGDIFVGAMMAVGFYLFAYNGSGNGRDAEFYLSKAACLFAIGVALFPTASALATDTPPTWTTAVAALINLKPTQVHGTAAILLFGCLMAIIWLFSNRAIAKGSTQRAKIYRAIAIAMGAGIIGLSVYGQIVGRDLTLWTEVWGLTLFGAGWLLAGSYKSN